MFFSEEIKHQSFFSVALKMAIEPLFGETRKVEFQPFQCYSYLRDQ